MWNKISVARYSDLIWPDFPCPALDRSLRYCHSDQPGSGARSKGIHRCPEQRPSRILPGGRLTPSPAWRGLLLGYPQDMPPGYARVDAGKLPEQIWPESSVRHGSSYSNSSPGSGARSFRSEGTGDRIDFFHGKFQMPVFPPIALYTPNNRPSISPQLYLSRTATRPFSPILRASSGCSSR